jgi:hypothetical protein
VAAPSAQGNSTRTITASVILLISCFWAYLATSLGTCTQGSADGLLQGGVESGIGYAAAIFLLVTRPPRDFQWLFLIPAIIAMGYEAYLAIDFSAAHYLHGLSACAWKEGIPEFEKDGREPLITAVWLGVPILGFGGLAVAWFRGRNMVRSV